MTRPLIDPGLSPTEAGAILTEAVIYGFPIVDNYRILHSYFVDEAGPEFKAPWNTLNNTANVYTPDDKAIQTPNSDTPYSQLGADLRTEPLVLSVPRVEAGRYYSLQFIDLYTHNFDYVGTRATGNEPGTFLLAGPGWNGEIPAGIDKVIRSETDLAFVLYRTQLFDPADIDNVRKIQAGYKVETLSQFLGQPAPAPAAAIAFATPLSAEAQRTSPSFFTLLNFALQFCPVHPSEVDLRARFARVGIEPGRVFDAASLPPGFQQAVSEGMANAWTQFAEYKRDFVDTGKVSSADSFGTRAFLKNNYMSRMSAAVLGIYGNSRDEAFYPAYFVGADGAPLIGSNDYILTMSADQIPPVNAFWSLTVYTLPDGLLFANPLNRYLINSGMLPGLKRGADGSVTLRVQPESPGPDEESNWLPIPEGPFYAVLRLYWPKPEALDGRWKQPALTPVAN